jgi:hypothetical protein
MVAQRPSDLVEIADTATALASAGHRITLLYLYAGSEIAAHDGALSSIKRLDGTPPDLRAIALDMLLIHRGAFENSQPGWS